MGNRQNQKKQLVIVGWSFAGLHLLDKVKNDYNIILVEKKDHFEWIWSLSQSILDLDYFSDNVTVNLKQCIETDQIFGNNVSYFQGVMTEIINGKSIKVKNTSEGNSGGNFEEIINYDILGKLENDNF